MFRWLVALVVLAASRRRRRSTFVAGRGAPPAITIDKPDRVVGQAGTLEVTAGAPGARLTR